MRCGLVITLKWEDKNDSPTVVEPTGQFFGKSLEEVGSTAAFEVGNGAIAYLENYSRCCGSLSAPTTVHLNTDAWRAHGYSTMGLTNYSGTLQSISVSSITVNGTAYSIGDYGALVWGSSQGYIPYNQLQTGSSITVYVDSSGGIGLIILNNPV